VGREHNGPVDRTDDVGDARGVRGQAAQRVGGGDHRVSGVEQRIDDGVPAGGLCEGAVDENDGGLHEKLLSGLVDSGRTEETRANTGLSSVGVGATWRTG
jgi:hypothetical protein